MTTTAKKHTIVFENDTFSESYEELKKDLYFRVDGETQRVVHLLSEDDLRNGSCVVTEPDEGYWVVETDNTKAFELAAALGFVWSED